MIAGLWRAAVSLAGLGVILVGVPAALVRFAGRPIPDTWPTAAQWEAWAAAPVTMALLRDYMTCAAWLAWAAITAAIVLEAAAAITRAKAPRLRLPAPLHAVAASLVGTAVVAMAGPAARASAPPAAVADATPSTVRAATAPQTTAHAAHVTLVIGDCSYRYRVHRGDTLSKIARTCLGKAGRWPEIWHLNKNKYWPNVSGKTRFRDPDVIFPGWVLTLPADAVPPPGATIVTPPATKPAPAPKTDASPAPTATTASPHQQPAPSVQATSTDDGITLPGGSFLPWTLAAAVLTAWTMVIAHRRRRYRPGDPATATPLDTPALIHTIRRAVHRHQRPDDPHTAIPLDDHPPQTSPDTPAPATPDPDAANHTGPATLPAARGVLVDTLTTRHDTRVIVTAGTLIALLGTDAVALQPWPRLTVTNDLDHALNQIEIHLLAVARQHYDTDGQPHPQPAPDTEAILLIADPPTPAQHTRAHILTGLGATAGVTALWLDDTAAHDHDQHHRSASLDQDTAAQLLATLREAHTGEPTPHTDQAPPPAADEPLDDGDTDRPDDHEADTAPVGIPVTTARLRVLGRPGIDDVTAPGRPLRAKALELAVYLACHPNGHRTRQIAEDLDPDARVHAADQRTHTNVSNLRHVLARAAGPRERGYVTQTRDGRYRLDPATVTVDLWDFHNLLRQAKVAEPADRRQLLQQACDLYQGPLADDHDYDWIEPHRETVRRRAVDAHVLLAQELAEDDLGAAAAVIDKAITIDPYNESLYQMAMQLSHHIGDTGNVAVLLQQLARRLVELGMRPTSEIRDLAGRLSTTTTAAS
ncbi:DNA-binding SARP family transcriptional activator/nucleoid-associated protein YgaU [Allocatelliglobosispora scoriae]|uniref:DNA-binding SARP family transcriptional activator/nucleoid-associated protein YgaU n=1 Tax=Allocatelliglobosispora scoriae TaxID=643052 RepID=A0A841C424_9ACTN|nr:BTAD domain-containing putative transcriptional regulator [Allocatelliglobosispora scoriae]MBB5874635.1 DNA-binding SARP family transcriptional activator/nucleoid-associated protein YgaU [Allocatelliglobosispora scoriae]